jgi:hypothetical protein
MIVDASVGDVWEVEARGFLGVLGEDVVEDALGLSCLGAAGSSTVVAAVSYLAVAGECGAGTVGAPSGDGAGLEIRL